VRREEEIASFKPSLSYAVRISRDGFFASSDKMDGKEDAQALCNAVNGQAATITGITKKEQKTAPPRLYDLTTLQREANRMFALSAKDTLNLAQCLYEKKLLTYPRTDSSFLTGEMEGSTKELLAAISGHDRFPFAFVGGESPDVKRVINSSKVSDHHALLPTPGVATADLSALSADEMTVLSMVVCRLFAAVSSPEVATKMEVQAECAGAVFRAKGKTVVSDGWRGVQNTFRAVFVKNLKEDKEEAEETETALPAALSEGQSFSNVSAQVDTIKTSPPAHFTEDTLLAAMERAGNSEYDDPDIEKKGLGTPATMADTIEGLVRREFLERQKKRILPTGRGCNLVKLLPLSLTSPKMTVEWETRLQHMAQGKGVPDSFMQEVLAFICTLIAEFDFLTPEQKTLIPQPKGRESLGSCPRCGSPVYEGKSNYYCSNRDHCSFFILEEAAFFKKARKKVTKGMIKDFLTKGKTNVKGLYSEKKGSTYDAVVVMEDTGEKWVNFKPVFEDAPKKSSKANVR